MDPLISTLALFGILYTIVVVLARLFLRDKSTIVFQLLDIAMSVVTFPGIILREASRKLLCDLAGVPVIEAKYFRLGVPAGYVMHDKVSRYRDAYLLTVGPFIVNTVFAMAMFLVSSFIKSLPVEILLLWLGASFAARALPGDGDAQGLWRWSKRISENNPLVFLVCPPVIITSFIVPLRKGLRVNVIYMVALYSVTFCLVAAILLAGSFTVPGAYSVKIASADPTASYELSTPQTPLMKFLTNYSQAAGTTGRTGLSDANVAGKEAPAKDWLSVAQDAMAKENNNAVLISVNGHSDKKGSSLPPNGKCHLWKYTYASRADSLVYDVTVHDGVLESVKKRAFRDSGLEGIVYKYGDPAINSWSLDSTDVAGTAYDKYKEQTGQEPASSAYKLELNYKGTLSWMVYFYDSTSRVTANINVDQATGSIIFAWIPTN